MRYVSTFSGVEAATLAWEPLGWEPVAFCEVDPFPSAVLAHRWPHVPNLGDITKVDWSCIDGAVDLVVGGSPCQSFSVAGKREGLEGASGLMFEYVRCVSELMPRWVVWENVPGALSSKGGADYGCLLRELDVLGYGLAWRVLDAQFFGVAQRRRRLFVVGHLGDMRACDVLFEPESLRWDHPSSREKRKELAARAGGGAQGAGGSLTPWDVQSKRVHDVEGPGPTLPSGTNEDANIQPCVLTEPAGFKFHAGSKANTIAYEVGSSPTLTADWHNPAVLYGIAGNTINRKPQNGGNGAGFCDPDDDGFYTLTAVDEHGVAYMTDTQSNTDAGEGGAVGALTAHSRKDPPVVAYREDSDEGVRDAHARGEAGGRQGPADTGGGGGDVADR